MSFDPSSMGLPEDPNDLNMPFERHAVTPHEEDFAVAGGVVVIAAAAPTLIGPQPMLVFRFANGDGSGFMPPIALAVNRSQLHDLPQLITQAIAAALEACGQ